MTLQNQQTIMMLIYSSSQHTATHLVLEYAMKDSQTQIIKIMKMDPI